MKALCCTAIAVLLHLTNVAGAYSGPFDLDSAAVRIDSVWADESPSTARPITLHLSMTNLDTLSHPLEIRYWYTQVAGQERYDERIAKVSLQGSTSALSRLPFRIPDEGIYGLWISNRDLDSEGRSALRERDTLRRVFVQLPDTGEGRFIRRVSRKFPRQERNQRLMAIVGYHIPVRDRVVTGFVSGGLSGGLEMVQFTSCDGNEVCFIDDDEFIEQYWDVWIAARSGFPSLIYTEIDGHMIGPGPWGPGRRELLPRTVIQLRVADSTDCKG